MFLHIKVLNASSAVLAPNILLLYTCILKNLISYDNMFAICTATVLAKISIGHHNHQELRREETVQ